MKGWSGRLHVRLAVLVFCLELLLLATLGLSVNVLCHRAFTEAFDQSLVADARTLAASYDVAEEPLPAGHGPAPGAAVLVPKEEIGPRALFAAFDGSGKLLAKSAEFASLPEWAAGMPAAPRFGPVLVGDRVWRGVQFQAEPEPDTKAAGTQRPAVVLFARSTRDVNERLEDIRRAVALVLGAMLLITAPLAGLLTSRALAPLRRLESEAEAIGVDSAGSRLRIDGVPADLAGLARAVNGMLDRLEQAMSRERRMAEDAAHEIRTPVAGLKAAIQAAQASPREPDEDRRTLGDLLADVNRLESLCESLLLSASPSTGAPPPVPPEVLGRWIAVIGEAYLPAARLAGGAVEVRIPPPPPGTPHLLAGEVTARRIVTNLLENALRHGGPRPGIVLSVTWGARGAAVTVEDHGPGVPPGAEAHLFTRFYRADDARARSTGGAGLGLSICRNLAEVSGGSVTHERTGEGTTRFTWTIRCAGPGP